MSEPEIDIESVVRRCPVTSWQGTVWRMHRRKYDALDPTGSRVTSGRFHRAPAQFPATDCWAALYLSLAPEITIAEVVRNTPSESQSGLNSYRLSEVTADVGIVIDCREIIQYGIPLADILRDYDFGITQEIAFCALKASAEAILVPSATRLGDNLVVFPDNLRPESSLTVIGSRDPVLYVDRN